MTDYFYLIPIALALGGIALGAFMWSLRSGQYDDLAGAAERILFENRDGPGDTAVAQGEKLHHRDETLNNSAPSPSDPRHFPRAPVDRYTGKVDKTAKTSTGI